MTGNPCLITGCDFLDLVQNRWVHGDLFRVGDTYIFNPVKDRWMNPLWHYQSEPSKMLVKSDEYVEIAGIIAVEAGLMKLSPVAEEYILG